VNINIVDAIPDDKPHCGNCKYFHDEDLESLLKFCEKKQKNTPSFGVCDAWERTENSEENI